MAEFIDVVSTSSRYKETLVNGYSDYEIECIEKLYDIDVSGQLLSFLKQIGRCAGSVIGGNELVFYSERSVRQQVLLQKSLSNLIMFTCSMRTRVSWNKLARHCLSM